MWSDSVRLMIFACSMLAATPALAAPIHADPAAPGRAAPEVDRILTDPALPERIGHIAGVLTRSLMNVPVGEVEAAIDGRPVTRADRQRTIGDSIGDPYAAQRMADQAAASGRSMQAAGTALARSLPAILQALNGAQAELERALGTLPSPYYPRR